MYINNDDISSDALGDEEMAQWAKCLLHEHESWSLCSLPAWDELDAPCVLLFQGCGGKDRQSSKACWVASESLLLNKIRWTVIEEDSMITSDFHTRIHEHVYIHSIHTRQ